MRVLTTIGTNDALLSKIETSRFYGAEYHGVYRYHREEGNDLNRQICKVTCRGLEMHNQPDSNPFC